MKISVIGAGSWGTTLAGLLAGKGYSVYLWIREHELAYSMSQLYENTWFLPGITLPKSLLMSEDISQVVKGAEYIIVVVPSQFFRAIIQEMRVHLVNNPVILSASKGIEVEGLKTMSQVVSEELKGLSPQYAVLSGPSFATEVSQGLPTAVSLGCALTSTGQHLQEILSTETFRVYYTHDYLGVELGGALKNVMAIAAGISDGLGFGTNARAALITRCLAEMSRLGEAMGARKETFMGLSGLGDLVLTCTGDLSRNRSVGLKVGQGAKLAEVLEGMKMVAEGVKTVESVIRLAERYHLDMPISKQVYQILYCHQDPQVAVRELMRRELKHE
jgi:glycerol-3-phosphate dehydrogenase (NAD(P)+)